MNFDPLLYGIMKRKPKYIKLADHNIDLATFIMLGGGFMEVRNANALSDAINCNRDLVFIVDMGAVFELVPTVYFNQQGRGRYGVSFSLSVVNGGVALKADITIYTFSTEGIDSAEVYATVSTTQIT